MTLPQLLPGLALAMVAGLVVHELGHVLAAGALGGHGFRITRVWPAVRIEATLPAGAGNEAVFLMGGAIANLGAAGALVSFGGVFALAAAVQVMLAVIALLPVGDSDGARLLALRR